MGKSNKSESVFAKRTWLFLAELLAIGMLAMWSLSAFYEHLDKLKASSGAYFGAAGTEAIMVILAAFGCYCWKIKARKLAHVLNGVCGVIILIHAGGVRGLLAAEVHQAEAETRLAENLGKLTDSSALAAGKLEKKQSKAIGAGLAAKNAQGTVAKTSQEAVNALTQFTAGTQDRVASASIFPRWYLNGGMFSVMFIVAFLSFSAVAFLAHYGKDIDRDYDGEVDEDEEVETLPRVQRPKDTPRPTIH